jgi:GTP-binding protein EngB required for normal cell division
MTGDLALGSLAQIARGVGRTDLATEAEAIAERTAAGRFFVACVGQFKRGKSTLLNALIGRSVLPVGVVPVTSAVTVLRYGTDGAAQVRFRDGRIENVALDELSAYVSEDRNPENKKGVAAVEAFVPSPLLASGMCLVDTPGLGSVFAGNTAVTLDFVPHIDAALVIIGADPPISGEELALVAEVAQHVRDLLFVLNKADRLTDDERRQAIAFTKTTIGKRLDRLVPRVFEVSAIERLRGEPTRDWAALESALGDLAARSGAELARTAADRGAALIRARLVHELDEQIGALNRPIAESEQRIASLKQTVAEAETALRELGHRLTAEEERLKQTFVARRDEFFARILPLARGELDAGLATSGLRGPALRRLAIELAQKTAHDVLEPKLREEEAAAEEMYREAMHRFVVMANDFLTRMASSGGAGLEGVSRDLAGAEHISTKSRYFLHELLTTVPKSPATWIADSLRSRKQALRAIQDAASEYLRHMLETNSARIQNDMIERMLESRRKLESEIRQRLAEVYRSAERALMRARTVRDEGADAVRADLARLDQLRGQAVALG